MSNTIEAPDARGVFPPAELNQFARLLNERQTLKALIKECEEKIGYTDDKKVRHYGLDDDIMDLMTEYSVPKLIHDGMSVTIVPGSRSTISKERLLELGVGASVIASATKVTTYSYLLVGAGKP